MRRLLSLGIVHRNRLFRECLATVLSQGERFEAFGVDHNHANGLECMQERQPGVVLIDLNLPSGLAVEWTQHIRQHLPDTKVIALARAHSHEHLVDCIAAGAHGCVLEESSLQDLQAAIDKVLSGETFCSPEIIHSMFHRLAETARESVWRQRVKSVDLTSRELEIMHLIAEGLGNKQIARRLSLSLYTVKNHVHNIVEKLQVGDRHEAVEYARQQKWLRTPGTASKTGREP